jgi:hypothetical protein
MVSVHVASIAGLQGYKYLVHSSALGIKYSVLTTKGKIFRIFTIANHSLTYSTQRNVDEYKK